MGVIWGRKDPGGVIWGRKDPGGPHVGSMNFAIWDIMEKVSVMVACALFYGKKKLYS